MAATNFIWDPVSDNLLMEKAGNGVTMAAYTIDLEGHGKLISQHHNGPTYCHHYDEEGSTRLLTDQNCDVVENAIYTAFGEVSFKMDTVTNPFGFRGAMGYYLDSQTGDLYFSGRTAHPKIGRWLAIDPTTLAYGLDSQAIGPEAMTFVNALGRMDPRDKLPDRIDPTKPSDVNPKGEGGCTTEFHPRFRDSAKNPRKCPKDWTLVVDGVTDTRLRKPATQLWQCVKCSVEFCKEGCDRKVPCQLSGLTHEAGNIILKAQRCQCTSLRP